MRMFFLIGIFSSALLLISCLPKSNTNSLSFIPQAPHSARLHDEDYNALTHWHIATVHESQQRYELAQQYYMRALSMAKTEKIRTSLTTRLEHIERVLRINR
ncbi:MAG: hypothetical protein ACRCV3_02620 [Desulfovibrionaceae bacterium]